MTGSKAGYSDIVQMAHQIPDSYISRSTSSDRNSTCFSCVRAPGMPIHLVSESSPSMSIDIITRIQHLECLTIYLETLDCEETNLVWSLFKAPSTLLLSGGPIWYFHLLQGVRV